MATISVRVSVGQITKYVVVMFLSLQNQENDMLKQILQKYVDQQVKVVVFNSKSKSVRGWLVKILENYPFHFHFSIEVTLVPCNTWGGQGLLGVSIRFCSFEGAAENIWHVLVS